MKKGKIDYFCDGICEHCDKSKRYGKNLQWCTCDSVKIKGLNVIAPKPYKSIND